MHGAAGRQPLEPNPRSSRSLAPSASTSTTVTGANGDDQQLRDAIPGRDLEGVVAVGVQQQHAQLAAIARVDQARAR